MSLILKDFPAGPLDDYRMKASFDWKKLKVFLDSEEIVKYEHDLWAYMGKTFGPTPIPLDFNEHRRKSALREVDLRQMELISLLYVLDDIQRYAVLIRTLMQFDSSASMKHSVHYLLLAAIWKMGSERHSDFLDMATNNEIMGCLCLTEIGHGSNAKGIRTTATFDVQTQEFLLNTPDFEAAKCWAGALGQTATHGVVFAQLYTQGDNHGIHAFVVPLRDTKTLKPLPGLTLGDMGLKIGLNGLDNGFAIFHNYRIPRENLLDKIGDVSPQGDYVPAVGSAVQKNSRHGATLGRFAIERVNVACACESLAAKAVTIAIRYSAVRKQFGPEGDAEVPIIEYQTQQFRLLPYLSAVYVLRIVFTWLMEITHQFATTGTAATNNSNEIATEIHAISAGSKSVAGWICRDAIQECREACGGHGYLHAAGIGQIRNDQDAFLTFEGEGHILIQQTSNWIMKFYPAIQSGQTIPTSPLKSIDFLNNFHAILQSKYSATSMEQAALPQTILNTYQWLVCHFLKQTVEKFDLLNRTESRFWARSKSEVFYAKNLSIAFIHHFFLQRVSCKIDECTDPALKDVLLKLFALYGLWNMEKFAAALYTGGYMESDAMTLVEQRVLQLCTDIKDDAVALVDVIGPPDFMLNSVLGNSDGEVYQRLEKTLLENTARPKWWKQVVHKNQHINKL